MKNQEKLAYEAPEMQVLVVELEQGIAAASGTRINNWGEGASGVSEDPWDAN